MGDIELIDAISGLAGNITATGLLMLWVFLERRRSDFLLQLLSEDWKRQREDEIEDRLKTRLTQEMRAVAS